MPPRKSCSATGSCSGERVASRAFRCVVVSGRLLGTARALGRAPWRPPRSAGRSCAVARRGARERRPRRARRGAGRSVRGPRGRTLAVGTRAVPSVAARARDASRRRARVAARRGPRRGHRRRARTTTLGRVGDDDVRALLRLRNQFEALVARIERRRGLRRSHREDFNALHVLLDVGAVDIADHGSTGTARPPEHPWGASRPPRATWRGRRSDW